jgi:PIN domain nuclease of toxin-antitoxin system
MQIKIQLGKLTLPAPLSILLQRQQQTNAIQILPITLPHVLELASLPDLHRDPFDRLLIAQARVEKASLISDDATIKKYPVTVVW